MAMRVERALLRTAFACAIFLLFGMLADRTTEIEENTTRIDAAGYNIAATFSGVVALTGLAAAFWTYPVCTLRRVIRSIAGIIIAVAAFALTAYVSGIYWLARLRGEVFSYASGDVLAPYPGMTIYPAVRPPIFATVAALGIIATLGVGVLWFRQGEAA